MKESATEIQKRGRLVFTGEDIQEFDWLNQTVKMTPEFMKTRKDYHVNQFSKDVGNGGGCSVLGVSANQHFALLLGDEIIYTGEFEQSPFSSYMPMGVVIGDMYQQNSTEPFTIEPDTFEIKYSDSFSMDIRFSKKLSRFLYDNGLLADGKTELPLINHPFCETKIIFYKNKGVRLYIFGSNPGDAGIFNLNVSGFTLR
jgi:hypothetical protein